MVLFMHDININYMTIISSVEIFLVRQKVTMLVGSILMSILSLFTRKKSECILAVYMSGMKTNQSALSCDYLSEELSMR